jgi:Domain of unknown function (DUF5134)
MAAPSWLAGTFAAIMILTAAYSASRLAFSRLRGLATELDADALHAVMGVAMAGMLVPWLHLAPDSVWAAVFGVGAAWFGWHALRSRGPVRPGVSRCRYPVPHLVECAAMIYMLLPVQQHGPGGPGMAMPGMSAAAGSQQGFPALAVILALFMLGYVVWTTDRLTSRAAQPNTVTTGMGSTGEQKVPVTTAVGTSISAAISVPDDRAGKPALAPRLAACTKIAMGLTMGCMLILMI